MKWKIGNVEIDNQVVLAPMAGFSNTTFRSICKEMGAGLVVAEMVSDKALLYESKKTYDLLKMREEERPISQQIFGSDIDSLSKAAKIIEEYMHPDIIDINMGCPVPKIVKNKSGSYLLKDIEKIKEIVRSVVKSVNVPVTVKIRSGWDEDSINAPLVAKIAEESGASAIFIHARTRSQGYSGNADWSIIKKVVESVSIPVIGNGDIKSCYDAKRMLAETKCTAVMIGRGALGNPWIIKECVLYLKDGTLPSVVSFEEKINMMKKHTEMMLEDKNVKVAILEMRANLMYYLKGMLNTKNIKLEILKCQTKEEILNVLDNYYNSYKENN